jgi:O-antigen/teichoic acid export membrane protein
MQKKFLTNLALLLFLNLLVKPFWVFGIDRSVQNAVGAEDFGFYFSILNFSFLFNIFLDLGIANFNNRNIAQNKQLLNKHFSGILMLKVLLGLGYILISFLIAWSIGYNSEKLAMLGWVAFNQFLLSFILYLRSNIAGLLLFKTDSIISVLDRLLMILFCSILLWGNITEGQFRIQWFVYAQTLAYGLTFIIALLVVIKKSAFRKLSWNWAFFVMIIKKSAPYALLILLMAQYNRIDSVIIERLLPEKTGEEQAGIYAMGFRLLDAANMIAYLFAVLLLPIFSRMIKLKQNIESLVKLSFSLLITTSVIVAVSSNFYSHDVMEWLYSQHQMETMADFTARIDQASEIFSLLMFGFVAMSIVYVFSTLLTANGSLKELNIIASAGVIISLVLNFILVPKIQATGSAYASLSAQFATSIAQLIAAIYIFKFKRNYRYILVLFTFIGFTIMAGYFSKLLAYDWRINLIIMASASFFFAIILRLINVKGFIGILRSEQE